MIYFYVICCLFFLRCSSEVDTSLQGEKLRDEGDASAGMHRAGLVGPVDSG